MRLGRSLAGSHFDRLIARLMYHSQCYLRVDWRVLWAGPRMCVCVCVCISVGLLDVNIFVLCEVAWVMGRIQVADHPVKCEPVY